MPFNKCCTSNQILSTWFWSILEFIYNNTRQFTRLSWQLCWIFDLHTSEQILTISEENSNYGKSSSPSVKACSNSKLKLHSKRHWFQSNLVWKGSVIASGTQIFADLKEGKGKLVKIWNREGTWTNSQSFQ